MRSMARLSAFFMLLCSAAALRTAIGASLQFRRSHLSMGVVIHGSPQSRSPLVNWFCEEAEIPYQMAAPRPSNHPFGQVPFLTDDDGVEVFESGAILLYLADRYGEGTTPVARAAYTKWVVWAQAELDGLCFGAVPGDHRVRGSTMGKIEVRSVAVLERLLGESEWIATDEFSVADVAVGSYLNYVPIFFPNADLSATPNTAAYMRRCAERPGFVKAFGEQHANLVKEKTAAWLQRGGQAESDGGNFMKKLLNL